MKSYVPLAIALTALISTVVVFAGSLMGVSVRRSTAKPLSFANSSRSFSIAYRPQEEASDVVRNGASSAEHASGSVSDADSKDSNCTVLSMGELVQGLEYPFETEVRFAQPVVGGKITSACGCMTVQSTQIDPTTLRLHGMLRVGGSGKQTKEIHVVGLCRREAEEITESSAEVNSETVLLRLEYTAGLAFRPSTNKILVEASRSNVSIELANGLLRTEDLKRPPELCGIWVTSSRWNNGKLEAELTVDPNSAESVPHYIRVFIHRDDKESEISIPVQVSKKTEFGSASSLVKLIPLHRDAFEGCLWMRGVPSNGGKVDVALSLWDSKQKLQDLPSLASCRVTPSGNLVRRFQLPTSSLLSHSPPDDGLRLRIVIGESSSFVKLDLGK